MALIGIEYNDHFADVRAVFADAGEDLTCPYYLANWFGPTLEDAGHQVKFLRSNHSVTERHMRDVTKGGDDVDNADSVDLFFIITHGNYNHEHRVCVLTYDTNLDTWTGSSGDWRFGDRCNMEWLLIYGCKTIDGDDIVAHHQVFQRLHLFCGAFGPMYDSWTIDEAGEDTANSLISGHTVADSWCEGVSDWFVSNHPMVISVERFETYNGGDPDWGATVIGSDHLWGHGTTRGDIRPTEQYWMAAVWQDGGIYG